jgi:hypothetical protein
MKTLLLVLCIALPILPEFHNKILILHPTATSIEAYVQNTDPNHAYNVTVETRATYAGATRVSQAVVHTPAGGKTLIPIVDNLNSTFTFTVLGETVVP